MPGCHRLTDLRFCGAVSDASQQDHTFVNNLIWTVEGDTSSHGNGQLKSVYSKRNIFIGVGERGSRTPKRVIVAIGDEAEPDDVGHPFPPTAPLRGSEDVICYNAEQVGDTSG